MHCSWNQALELNIIKNKKIKNKKKKAKNVSAWNTDAIQTKLQQEIFFLFFFLHENKLPD